MIGASRSTRRGFTLAELLVVLGIIALLLSLILPPLRLARDQAIATHCAANKQQLGHGLEQALTEFNFYPVWDDGGAPIRYTWIDVLAERGYTRVGSGYCGKDKRPDFLNEARGQAFGLLYPPNRTRFGVNYSYGISVPLSSGSWAWTPTTGDGRPRRLTDHLRDTSRRVLASDANWTSIYNLGAGALGHGIWNQPTQFDNTIAYRHNNRSANFLFQDGHVERARYDLASAMPIDTVSRFVWRADESLTVGPEDSWAGNFYPAYPAAGVPPEVRPQHYTVNRLWNQVPRY